MTTVARVQPPLSFRPGTTASGDHDHAGHPHRRPPAGQDRRTVDSRTEGERRQYRTVFISDLHLGTRFCRTDLLLDFLDTVDCDHLFLVGDIVDGWRLRRSWFWDGPHNQVV